MELTGCECAGAARAGYAGAVDDHRGGPGAGGVDEQIGIDCKND
jgi:hypothetical protein